MAFDIPRKRLREMGVPEDMSADDVVALFSLPDDDDTMHMQTRREGPDRKCAHGKLFTESCAGCGYVIADRRKRESMTSRNQGTTFRAMVDVHAPPIRLLAKIGSILAHVEEGSGEGGHEYDWAAVRSLLADREVQDWLYGMQRAGLLPVKRS